MGLVVSAGTLDLNNCLLQVLERWDFQIETPVVQQQQANNKNNNTATEESAKPVDPK